MSDTAFETECVVIGAGVVGLACAAAIARSGREVIVLEAADGIGTGVSSRNSEVIHAGIYYPTNSFKHRMCIVGRRRLYPYLTSRGVAHRKCGKLIVATNAEEEGAIEGIYKRALTNEVENVSLISGADARALEPQLQCVSALVSPETGIVDSHGLMLALLGDIEAAGGALALSSPVLGGTPLEGGGFELDVGGEAPTRIRCRWLVNAAGLRAHEIAASIDPDSLTHAPPLTLAKGNYFGCAGKPAFSRLIYPAPVDGGLGVHLTIDLAGRMRFGPDVEWLESGRPDEIDYAVDAGRGESFYAAIRRYWPALPEGALQPDYSGCRPKLSGKGEPAADFRIDGAETHGREGLVNLLGIESPGLTSALAIAEETLARLEGHGAQAPDTLRPIVFFDRDGTLNVDVHFAHLPEQLRWVDGAIEAVRAVNEKGWLAVVVTNQSGIGRGLFDEAAVDRFHAHMQAELAAAGAHIDAFFQCPFHGDATVERYRVADHADRKPNPGMLLKAFRALPADPMRGLMIGDKDIDLEAGARAGVAAARHTEGSLADTLREALSRLDWAKVHR